MSRQWENDSVSGITKMDDRDRGSVAIGTVDFKTISTYARHLLAR